MRQQKRTDDQWALRRTEAAIALLAVSMSRSHKNVEAYWANKFAMAFCRDNPKEPSLIQPLTQHIKEWESEQKKVEQETGKRTQWAKEMILGTEKPFAFQAIASVDDAQDTVADAIKREDAQIGIFENGVYYPDRVVFGPSNYNQTHGHPSLMPPDLISKKVNFFERMTEMNQGTPFSGLSQNSVLLSPLLSHTTSLRLFYSPFAPTKPDTIPDYFKPDWISSMGERAFHSSPSTTDSSYSSTTSPSDRPVLPSTLNELELMIPPGPTKLPLSVTLTSPSSLKTQPDDPEHL